MPTTAGSDLLGFHDPGADGEPRATGGRWDLAFIMVSSAELKVKFARRPTAE
jgi:hypothetical protein